MRKTWTELYREAAASFYVKKKKRKSLLDLTWNYLGMVKSFKNRRKIGKNWFGHRGPSVYILDVRLTWWTIYTTEPCWNSGLWLKLIRFVWMHVCSVKCVSKLLCVVHERLLVYHARVTSASHPKYLASTIACTLVYPAHPSLFNPFPTFLHPFKGDKRRPYVQHMYTAVWSEPIWTTF